MAPGAGGPLATGLGAAGLRATGLGIGCLLTRGALATGTIFFGAGGGSGSVAGTINETVTVDAGGPSPIVASVPSTQARTTACSSNEAKANESTDAIARPRHSVECRPVGNCAARFIRTIPLYRRDAWTTRTAISWISERPRNPPRWQQNAAAGQARFFSRDANCLRNLATFGPTTAMQ